MSPSKVSIQLISLASGESSILKPISRLMSRGEKARGSIFMDVREQKLQLQTVQTLAEQDIEGVNQTIGISEI